MEVSKGLFSNLSLSLKYDNSTFRAGIWHVSNQDNIFHAVMMKLKFIYFISEVLDLAEITFDTSMVILSFELENFSFIVIA